MKSFRLLPTAACAALILTACTSAPPGKSTSEPSTEPVPVLLVSIDGMRADYLERGITPNLVRLAKHGVRARWMTPSYPSLTFPNHYSIVTGLRPDSHGIVNNTMYDDALGEFKLSNRQAVGDSRWWQGEPVWVGAEKAGLPSATMFWPGSEAPVQGVRPRQWYPYDKNMALDTRVDHVLEWLAQPAATRPRLATLYFEIVDTTGHDHGPDSAEMDAAIRQVDDEIGRLVNGLARQGMRDRVNLIVVSDHGMAATSPERAIAVEDMVSPEIAKAMTTGQVVGFVPMPGHVGEAENALIGRHPHAECWRKAELPARWHYGSHPRIPPIVCQVDEGWLLVKRKTLESWRENGWQGGGSHGYDPALASMRAIFIARGPAFRQGAVIPAFDNVDVYPLLTRLIGIAPDANDGDPETLRPALR